MIATVLSLIYPAICATLYRFYCSEVDCLLIDGFITGDNEGKNHAFAKRLRQAKSAFDRIIHRAMFTATDDICTYWYFLHYSLF